MKTLSRLLVVCFLLTGLASIAVAETVVVDFDDYIGPLAPIPPGYAGFTSWGSWAYSSTESSGYFPLSGTTYATSVGAPVPIVFPAPYVFLGAWFQSSAPTQIAYELYVGDVVVHTSDTFTMTPNEYTYYASGYDGAVESVKVLYIALGNGFSMDDFAYENGTVAAEARSLSYVKQLYR